MKDKIVLIGHVEKETDNWVTIHLPNSGMIIDIAKKDLKIVYPRMTAMDLAKFMHYTYEDMANRVGWETQENCRVPWEELPITNQATMFGVACAVLEKLTNKDDLNK